LVTVEQHVLEGEALAGGAIFTVIDRGAPALRDDAAHAHAAIVDLYQRTAS
jgi:hypothetical protein